MGTTQSVLTVPDSVERWLVESDLSVRLRAVQAQPTGGCNACRFADPLNDRLCTIPDISADVAATVGIIRRFVYKWAQRFLAKDLEGLVDKPGRGSRRALRRSGGERYRVTN